MQLGAAMLHVDWLGGRTLADWQFGVKLLCGRFPQIPQTSLFLFLRFIKRVPFCSLNSSNEFLFPRFLK
jgi:hypothetical protein